MDDTEELAQGNLERDQPAADQEVDVGASMANGGGEGVEKGPLCGQGELRQHVVRPKLDAELLDRRAAALHHGANDVVLVRDAEATVQAA